MDKTFTDEEIGEILTKRFRDIRSKFEKYLYQTGKREDDNDSEILSYKAALKTINQITDDLSREKMARDK